MATSTTIKPKDALSPDLQAINPIKLVKLIKKIFDLVKKYWKEIGGAGVAAKEAWDFVSGLLQPKTSPEYQSMTDDGKKAIDKYSGKLIQAFSDGDRTGVISSLQDIANTYEVQSRIAADPTKAKALQDKAQQIRNMADGIANGDIPMDRGISDRVKELDSKEEKQYSEMPLSKAEESLQELNQNLEKLVAKALVELGVDKINSTNSRQVAGELLSMGALPDVAKQALAHHYEATLGMTKTQSAEEAAKNVMDATSDNKLDTTASNNQDNSSKIASNQREMG
jgi:uncharacterized protein YbjQ (UPF0145 family)